MASSWGLASVSDSRNIKPRKDRIAGLVQGITILHPNPETDPEAANAQEIEYDIVAVPGLGAHPIDCWKYTESDSGTSSPAFSPGSKSTGSTQTAGTDASSHFNWLVDAKGLISQFPRARIMLYQYASAWRGDFAVRNPFDHIASGLLEGLRDNRNKHQDKRPIIFIGHSMGGLVIAKAMCLANAEPEKYAKVYKNVTSCIFFGTPFYGARVAQLAINFCDFKHLFRTDDNGGEVYYDALLRFMTWKNLELLKLTTEFMTLARSMQPEITLFCFWELKSLNWRNKAAEFLGLKRYVPSWALAEVKNAPKERTCFVERESAVLEDETNKSHGLSAYHEDLVRFPSSTDESYLQVLAHIRPLISNAVQTVRSRLKQKTLDDNKVASIRSLLESSVNMRVKLRTLSANSPADEWLLQQPTFDRWRRQLDGAPNCLCIQGPPGYGKTAASIATANFVDATIRAERVSTSPRESLTLYACFFCDTHPGCSTAEDLLRSVLLQIIEQAPALAAYAENFLKVPGSVETQHPEVYKRENARESHLGTGEGYNQVKATLSVENLWQCLTDMLTDISLHAVYIVINNVHRLEQDESLSKLLYSIQEDLCSRHPNTEIETTRHFGRWFFTTYGETRKDLSRCFGLKSPCTNVSLINLKDPQFVSQVKLALTNHVRERTRELRIVKGYDYSLAFEVEKIIDRKAENKQWVDVLCLQLQALPDDKDRLTVKERLEAAASGSLRKLVEDAWRWIFHHMDQGLKKKVQDVLRALVLLDDDVTLQELSSLTDYDSKDLAMYLSACAPMVSFTPNDDRVIFVSEDIRASLFEDWSKLLISSRSNGPQEDRAEQIAWQHGYLAWKCFSYLEHIFQTDSSSTTNDAIDLTSQQSTTRVALSPSDEFNYEKADEVDEPSQDDAPLSTLTCTYAVKNWMYHVAGGGANIAQSLFADMSQFWEPNSIFRTRWLRRYKMEKPDAEFEDLQVDGMTALHVTAALGLADLSFALLESDKHKHDIQKLDSNRYTPLHLAALNNHLTVVKLLLERGADIEESQTVASPLHLAAVQGHVEIMRELLASESRAVKNVNALSKDHGPVINAAIQSGVINCVKELLKHKDLSLDFDDYEIEPPLVLAARMSTPALFRDILEAGTDTWKPKHCEDALVRASYNGRLECVDALISYHQTWDNACIQSSLLSAGVEDSWQVVTRLLDIEAELDYYDIFYLSATTLAQQDEILKRIWELAKSNIPQNIVDAALYRATDNEKVSTVRWLLEVCNANPNATADAPDKLDKNSIDKFPGASYGDALTAAAFDGNIELIKILLAHKAKVDGDRGAALQTAARRGHKEAVTILLDEGAEIDRLLSKELMTELNMEYYSGSALQAACDYRNPEIVKVLLSRGADPNLRHPQSWYSYPLISATWNNQATTLNHLLNTEGIEVNIKGGLDGSFPLQSACANMDLQCVERLLEKGADINAIDPDGDQAIHLAACTGNLRVLEFLLQHNADVTHNSELRGLAIQQALRNNQIKCATLLAGAIEPILKALTDAAADKNDFAESIITNPRGQHPRINTERYKSLEKENAELQARNTELRAIEQDYDNMKEKVAASSRFASAKVDEAEQAKTEAENTHRRYGISIEGYEAAARERDALRKKVPDLEEKLSKLQETSQAQELNLEEQLKGLREQNTKLAKRQATDADIMQGYNDNIAALETQVKKLQEDVDRLSGENARLQSADDNEARGSIWSATSVGSDGRTQSQSRLSNARKSTDHTDAASIAPSESSHLGQGQSNKERRFMRSTSDFKDFKDFKGTMGKLGLTRKKNGE